jgi:bifunctional enzyme CysN/CysC
MNIAVTTEAPQTASRRPLIRIVIAGHVDHGKSTLIGRLLHETGTLPEGKLELLKTISKRRGMPFEWSFLLDSLQTERDQGITIDTSQIRFRSPSRDFVLIDAPGHAEFLRNMITGASQADAAILLVDATEGVRDQTRRHGYLLHLLGIRQIVAVVNKMDKVAFNAKQFGNIEQELREYLSGIGCFAQVVIPISAREGDNVVRRSEQSVWYEGPTILAALDSFSPTQISADLPLRVPVQAIYKFDDRRILAGRVESGSLSVGDEIIVMPGRKTARVKSIEAWPAPNAVQVPQVAHSGQSIGITTDRDLFIERGNVIALAADPSPSAHTLRARIFWLPQEPLNIGDDVVVRVATAEAHASVLAVDHTIDPGGLTAVGRNSVGQNQIGEIELLLARPLSADRHDNNPVTGRIVIEREGRIAGGGLILDVGSRTQAQPERKRALRSVTRPKPRELFGPDFALLTATERLIRLRHEIVGKITFTTSFGLEDQAITHLIAENALDIDIATLDTGRLFPETYEVWAETERRYRVHVTPFYPDATAVETFVSTHGINGFYNSKDARLSCCHIRKVEPLNRALADSEAWVTGLRADQSRFRSDTAVVSIDEQRGLIKMSPVFDWTRDEVLTFNKTNGVPINALHDKGFASIGCAPCTRAVAAGELERAGRWWWEQDGKTECGLHASK